MNTNGRTTSRDGALLIAVVIGLTAAMFLGMAVLSMATSARFQRIHYGTSSRAYYLAESGGSYARAIRNIIQQTGETIAYDGLYTLSNGDQFLVETLSEGPPVVVRSTGIANPGSHIEARRRLIIEITDTKTDDTLPVGFDFDGDGAFDEDYWTAYNLDPKIRDTGPSGGQPALDLKGEEGQLALNWQPHEDLNLTRVWGYNGGLLSYDVQVKIKPFDTGQQAAYSKHYMLGISFRLHPDINHCYGLSYFRSLAGTVPGHTPSWVRGMPQAFQDLRGTNIYLVLWYRDGEIGTMDLINYRLLTPADPVVEVRNNDPELKDYSTMLLQLKEQYGSGGVRENHVTAYLQGTSSYPLWTSRTNMVWQEDTSVFPAPVTWQDGAVTNLDSRLTSENFDSIQPAEIGIHVFYDLAGANHKFFDDFAIRMEGYASVYGGTQIQY